MMNAHSCNLQYFSDHAAARWFVHLRNASRKLWIKAATEITTGTYQAAQPAARQSQPEPPQLPATQRFWVFFQLTNSPN